MFESNSADDVGAAFDRAWATDLAIPNGLGRHDNDRMFSFYVASPAGFMVEVGHGARVVTDDWDDNRQYDRISMWGHQPLRQSRLMKVANSDGRAVLVLGDEIADIAEATGGRFGPDPMDIYANWADSSRRPRHITAGTAPLIEADLRCPVPMPHQVFAIGLNYRSHAEESGMAIPEVPATFTKFPASLAGPFDDIEIVGESTDWEVELVAVIGRRADRVSEADGWSYVAGLTVGQDISDRHLQFAAASQFSLGKSRRGYGPMGPWVVTLDEFSDPDDLALGCSVDGETMQDARTG